MIRQMIANWQFKKAALELSRMIRTGTGDMKYFREPSESLSKSVRIMLGIRISFRDWDEAWCYLICRTRVQCILQGVPLDFDNLCTGQAMIDMKGSNAYLRNRWNDYSQTEAPEGVSNEAAPSEKAIAWARLYVHFLLEQLSKDTGINVADVEKNISNVTYLAIAAKTEKLAVKICKKLAKNK
jgi:hypothetical protein